MDKSLVQALRARDVDVITALDADLVEADDERQLDFATSQQRILYSFNVGDFYRLHTVRLTQGQSKSHAGIILSQQQHYSVGEQMRRFLRLIAEVPAEEMNNRIEFLSAWSSG
jgi:hypothetical protein